jgi:hypothetical protein
VPNARLRIYAAAFLATASLGLLVFGVDIETTRTGYLVSRVVVGVTLLAALWFLIRIVRRDRVLPAIMLVQIAAFWCANVSWIPQWIFFVRHRAALEASLEGGPMPPLAEEKWELPAEGSGPAGVEWLFPSHSVFGGFDAFAILHESDPRAPRRSRHGPRRHLTGDWYFAYVSG